MLIRRLDIKKVNSKQMNETHKKIGRPRKNKVGRPKVEKLFIVEGSNEVVVMDKDDLQEDLKNNNVPNGTIIKEVILKATFKVVRKETQIIRI